MKDAAGNPIPNVSVTFAVTQGSGSVAGSPATTNASGIATLTSWTLGNTAGANALSATAPGGLNTSFTATGTAGAATKIQANASPSGNVNAGAAITPLPSVIVLDQFNNPVPNVSVTFAVTAGAGATSGLSQLTSPAGIATVGGWSAGALGANTMTATSGSLTGSPISFTVTSVVGPPASITKTGGDAQHAAPSTALTNPLSVVVRDAAGNPIVGASVLFAVTAGGGSIAGATAITDATGTATSGIWTLGATVGSQAATATVNGLTTTFTATAP